MTWWQIVLIILLVLIAVLAVLFYVGTRLRKKQAASQEQMEAMKQTLSILVIDKKKMRLKEANLPDVVMQQTPKYMRRAKMPFVKAKVGPRVMTLIADPRVYEQIPVKKECKVTISGIYITEIKSVRGGSVLPLPQKKSLLDRIRFPKRSSKEATK